MHASTLFLLASAFVVQVSAKQDILSRTAVGKDQMLIGSDASQKVMRKAKTAAVLLDKDLDSDNNKDKVWCKQSNIIECNCADGKTYRREDLTKKCDSANPVDEESCKCREPDNENPTKKNKEPEQEGVCRPKCRHFCKEQTGIIDCTGEDGTVYSMGSDSESCDLQTKCEDNKDYLVSCSCGPAKEAVEEEGAPGGAPDGATDSTMDGAPDGALDGTMGGAPDGATDGSPDSTMDGTMDGALDGAKDGSMEG